MSPRESVAMERGQGELAGVGAVRTPLVDELAVGSEMVDALVVGFEDEDVAVLVAAHALGFAEVRLGHLPGKEKGAVRGKLLHPPGHVHHVEVVLEVHGDGARFVQFADADAASADDLDAAEDGAVEGALAGIVLRAAAEEYQAD